MKKTVHRKISKWQDNPQYVVILINEAIKNGYRCFLSSRSGNYQSETIYSSELKCGEYIHVRNRHQMLPIFEHLDVINILYPEPIDFQI